MKQPNIIFLMIYLGTVSLSHHHMSPFHRCGYHTNKNHGYISTPNFPKSYPVPIICQWVIEAPPDCRVAVYFTQFYLKTGFSASEFAHYMGDIGFGVRKSDFGIISSNDEPTYLVSNQRILVLNLQVHSLDNVHLRVTEHLLETYGFNITYEVLRKNDSVRQDGCIYHHCSFTGFCMATEDLEKYHCNCVTGYFGVECQYDENCGPTATPQVCFNGGTCRYYIGSSVRTCECPPGFEGAKCEIQRKSEKESQETGKNCEVIHYTSHPDYIAIYPENRTCPPKGKDLYILKANLNVTFSGQRTQKTFNLTDVLQIMISSKLRSLFSKSINMRKLIVNGNTIEIRFVAEDGNSDTQKSIKENIQHLHSDSFSSLMSNMKLQIKSMIFIERTEISEKMPIMEGIPLLIACIVRGRHKTNVKWLKDNSSIVFPHIHGRLWKSTIPKNSFETSTFLLGIDKTHVLDSGLFTCLAEDETGSDKLTVTVTVKQLPKPLLTPLSATLRSKDSLTITCVSQEVHLDRNVTYFWTRDDGPLIRSREQVEDLFPSGSRVILNKPLESANYTCAIHSKFGIRKETSVIKVISDKDFSTSTCHRETLFGINWKLTAADSEDFHLCPSNYTGYIFRKCLKAENHSTIWQEPDFSRCLSPPFLEILNGFRSYALGYRMHTLLSLMKKMIATISETLSSLHMSEAEPLVDILSKVDPALYLKKNALENWKSVLNMTSMLLNSSSVSRNQSKRKMYSLIRNVSLTYGRQHLLKNSSQEFVSPTLTVKVWKIHKEYFRDPFVSPRDLHSFWNSNSMKLQLKFCNSSDFEGNSSVTVTMIIFRSHRFAGKEKLPTNFIVSTNTDDFLPVVITEAKSELSDISIPVKVLLTYKDIGRIKKKSENLSCYKIPETGRNQSIQSCEKIQRFGKNIVCHCFSSGLLSVMLLLDDIKLVKDGVFNYDCENLPVFGGLLLVLFVLVSIGVFRVGIFSDFRVNRKRIPFLRREREPK